LAAIAAILLGWNWSQSAPLQTAGAPAAGLTSFRIIFGALQERSLDYSGSVSVTGGKLVHIAPWRFFGSTRSSLPTNGSSHQADSAREPARSAAPAITPGQIPMLSTAGVTVTVDAPPTATAHVTTAQGAFDIRLSDMRSGRPLS